MHSIALIRKPALVFLALSLGSYLGTLFFGLFLNPAPLANVLGFLSLIIYMATLVPGIFRTVFPVTKSSKIITWLLRNRRYLGITAFVLASNHGLLMIVQKQINLLTFSTYLEYFQGMTMLTIFTFMTITSNDYSVKTLKKSWKKLHRLTYLVIFLLPWHILDKMFGHWTYLTPIEVLLTLITVFLFLRRKWMESVR